MLELSKDYQVTEITNQEFNVAQINSISKKHPKWRQLSKAPTFALTFAGTYHTLMSNCGFSMEDAKSIEQRYHKLYAVSDAWVYEKIRQAHTDGYSLGAFGLRIRTPLLKQVVHGAPRTPYEASAEARTLGNAISGQSYGQLNNRAAVDFWKKVWASPYRYDILPVAMIHDAIYAIVRNELAIVEWTNRELIVSMSWQELPELHHPTVKLGAALDLFWPNWANPITLPNNANMQTILDTCIASQEGAQTKE